MGTLRPFWHLLFVGLTGVPTFLTTYYYYQLLTQIDLFLVVPIGLFVVGEIWLILWLSNHGNPALKSIGKSFGVAFQYLALFQGLLLTVLVFYVLGGGETAGGPNAFYADFVLGATWLSMFIYGATGAPVALASETVSGKIMGWLYAAVALVPPFWLVMFQEDTLRAFAAHSPGTLILLALGYYVAMSVIGMWLLVGRHTGARNASAGGS